jgi:hypothetical protein
VRKDRNLSGARFINAGVYFDTVACAREVRIESESDHVLG